MLQDCSMAWRLSSINPPQRHLSLLQMTIQLFDLVDCIPLQIHCHHHPHIKQLRGFFTQIWWSLNIDLFTTRFNRQLRVYVSPVPDPQTQDMDETSFGKNWMPMPISLPYSSQKCYSVPRSPLPPAHHSKMANMTVVPFI